MDALKKSHNSIYENHIKINKQYIQNGGMIQTTWSAYTVAQLKQALKDFGLPLSGKKSILVKRLEDTGMDASDYYAQELAPRVDTTYSTHDDYLKQAKPTVVELKATLKYYGLSMSGKKDELLQRLKDSRDEIGLFQLKSVPGKQYKPRLNWEDYGFSVD